MSVTKCRNALVTAFMDGNFFTQKNIAFENMKFDPGSDPWAALYFVPAQPVVATLGAGGQDHLDGFLQIDLNFPQHTGEKAINDKFDAIRSRFTAGARFADSGQEVIISSCGRSQGRVVNGFFKVSVTVVFYARITR